VEDLVPLRLSDYLLILAATAIWAVFLQWIWHAQLLERLLQIDLDATRASTNP
jgi:hypothetical protein